MYSVAVNPPVWWRQHLFGAARLQPPPLWGASKTSFSCPSGAGRMPGEWRLTRMFSLPFISCFSHLDSEIPSVFLSVLSPPHRRTYSSHAEKHTKSSNLSSLPLLFCHTRLNCISSAVQTHLRRVRLRHCRQERSIPVPRKKGCGIIHGSCKTVTKNEWAILDFYVNNEKSRLVCFMFFPLNEEQAKGTTFPAEMLGSAFPS